MGLQLNTGKTQILPQVRVQETLNPYRGPLEAISEALRAAWLANSPYELSEEERPTLDAAVTSAALVALFQEQVELTAPDPRILRFCIRQFRAFVMVEDVLDEVLENLDRLVVVTQAVVPYLVRVASDTEHGPKIAARVTEYLRRDPAYDWQVMWLLQLLYRLSELPAEALAFARALVLEGRRAHDALAVSAILLLGKHGDHADREALTRIYDRETSLWVKRAILFAIQDLPGTQRNHFYNYRTGRDALTDRVIEYVRERT